MAEQETDKEPKYENEKKQFEALPKGLEIFNGGIECDAWTGPCSCGAWHDYGDKRYKVIETRLEKNKKNGEEEMTCECDSKRDIGLVKQRFEVVDDDDNTTIIMAYSHQEAAEIVSEEWDNDYHKGNYLLSSDSDNSSVFIVKNKDKEMVFEVSAEQHVVFSAKEIQ